jgi:hypothetical protein
MIKFENGNLLWVGTDGTHTHIGHDKATSFSDTNLVMAIRTFRNILDNPTTLTCISNSMDKPSKGRELEILILGEILKHFYIPNVGQESHIDRARFRNELFLEMAHIRLMND